MRRFIDRHNAFPEKGRLYRFAALLLLFAALALTVNACSSDDELSELEYKTSVQNVLLFQVNGVRGAVNTNVMNYLNSIPPIESDRARFFVREIRDNLEKALRVYGYYNPKIDIIPPERDDPGRTMVINIDQGKPLFIRQADVKILGEGMHMKEFEDVIRKSGIRQYAILNHDKYEDLKVNLKAAALSLGFFDSEIVVARILVYEEQNVADINLFFDTGRRYKFGEFIMNDETRELLIPSNSLISIHKGDYFSTEAINYFNNRLTATGFYRVVDITPHVADADEEGEIPMELVLERQPHNIVKVGVGYSTDEGARVLLEWEKPLLNQYGHSLSTYAKVSTVQQDAQVVYKIPRRNPIDDYYYIKGAQIYTDLNDTESQVSHLSFHYVANQTGRWRRDWSIRAEYEDYEQGLEKGTTVNLMPGLLLSRRVGEGGMDPHYAQSFSIDFTGGLGQITDYTFFRTDAKYRLILSPTEDTRFLVRYEQGATMGGDAIYLPPSLRFFAGGDNSVRGYGYLTESPRVDGYLKGGKYLSVGSAEFQFPFGLENQRLALFVDAGLATDDYEDADEYILGPGFGYRYLSSYGAIRVDLGFGIDKDPTKIRLHFAFGPEF